MTVSYFSDVLCVWACVAQIRLDELRRQFGDQIRGWLTETIEDADAREKVFGRNAQDFYFA